MHTQRHFEKRGNLWNPVYALPAHKASLSGTAVSASPWTGSLTPKGIGNLLVVSIGNFYGAGTQGTFGISGGGLTWNQLNAVFNFPTGQEDCQSWYAVATGTSAVNVSVTNSGTVGTTTMNGFIDEFEGCYPTQPDKAGTGSGTTGAPTMSLTPVAPNCMLWGFAFASITGPGAGYTIGGNDGNGDGTEFKLLSGQAGSAQTVNFAGTSGNFIMLAATLSPIIEPGWRSPTAGPSYAI